jgi:phospholipid/cholesterol/gamma-HCH transport system substrate-binding protein
VIRIGLSPARRPALAVAAVSVLGAVAGCGVLGGEDPKTLTAYFDRTVGLYVESDVRVLGVRIGEVTALHPEGDRVRVEMQYDADQELPADARAVVVAPSIVSDRYVQLTPVHSGGEVLPDGATIENERTAVPVELDQIYAALDELNVALGPRGANRDGALSDLVSVGADNLAGNGELLDATLEDFSTLVTTLSEQREDLFGTVANLQDFTSTIAASDTTVRAFNRDLAQVAAQLEAEREDLARAVRELSVALGEVAGFVRENKDDLTANVSELASVTSVLVRQRTALEEFLDVSPTALSNLQLAYNPSTGTLDTRDNGATQAEQDPAGALCNLIVTAGLPPVLCQELSAALSGLPSTAGAGGTGAGLPVAPRPLARDMTLGGILDGGR